MELGRSSDIRHRMRHMEGTAPPPWLPYEGLQMRLQGLLRPPGG